MDEKEVVTLITVLVLLVLVAVIITLFSVFVKRKNKLLEEQNQAKEAFNKELSEIQIEIREETLRNISWELHDNIGQLMTLAKIQAQMAVDAPENFEEVAGTIGNAIQELRALSKLINPEALKSLSLKEALQLEIERFNRLNFIKATLKVEGVPKRLASDNEIILFRILQEFFTNTIKHSKASNLMVTLKYLNDSLHIEAKDDGVGFNATSNFAGIGMKNMKNRAKVVKAKLKIHSEKGKGTMLQLSYDF
ncbi:sensor histidine kinase [Cochleicola gelatinilyticus]|uniref:histidine kinase n=1 Tax=Cochleicola gelatinilyticus TaxID=1763537 RepID=A0A167HH15_9FLAO|nr:ATP-binding protein [Cochleicola gelatinilyticus]OAB78595.1 histidine kinase [Cochleicola gelatinilyticus]